MLANEFRILPLQENDLSAVLKIERQSYPFPWSADQFRQELNNPVATVELLWHADRLAGYLCYWLIAGELQILNIATSPDSRRQGVAGRLLEHAFASCMEQGLERAWLEVRTGNRAAIELYRKEGFVADTVRSGYYRDGEDALLMVRDFSGGSVADF
ncbi:ribosomal protein S18-alanine N-acetyltransferase [Malonomonas rubra]|uniref:ribosomal protein S18-alanine N-acetyltransferase n=1 Tax=Malonomonas rubra TaxID=57040 RepID=UPI0026F231E2|nr:ribosomal protein S18-alanine N-acetyltransferase [Malonomonas rubra]